MGAIAPSIHSCSLKWRAASCVPPSPAGLKYLKRVDLANRSQRLFCEVQEVVRTQSAIFLPTENKTVRLRGLALTLVFEDTSQFPSSAYSPRVIFSCSRAADDNFLFLSAPTCSVEQQNKVAGNDHRLIRFGYTQTHSVNSFNGGKNKITDNQFQCLFFKFSLNYLSGSQTKTIK